MKYILVFSLFLVGCNDFVSKEDTEMANCVCQKYHKSNAKNVKRDKNWIGFGCENIFWEIGLPDDKIIEGCPR